jgi:protein ImuB
LSDVARTMSARVEQAGDGAVFFDCEGSGALCASEAELATILGARAERQGLPAWVGIADSKPAARIAAREGRGVGILPPGATRARLAPLPVALLDPDDTLAATLASWGLRTIGDLAALPSGAVAHRLGPSGARLARLARGEEDEPLDPQALPQSFGEALELDYGIERLDPLVFVLRRLVDCMMGRLALHGLACAALEIHFDLLSRGRYVRHLPLAAPTTDCKTLLTVLRAHLESDPPGDAVRGLAIAGVAARVRPVQLDFFQPKGPSPAALAATIARLAALCGADRVGTPQPSDSHRPDMARVAPFTGDGGRASGNTAASDGTRPATLAPVALRAFRPPAALEVFECAGRLDYIRGRGFGGRVVHQAGPWRLGGEWWTVDPFAREYYDVELSDGGVYRIFRDVRHHCWRADGMYD